MSQESVAVVHGRFQIFHLEHLDYILAGKSRCDLLIIGITNPDPFQTQAEETDPNRGESISNPCTFYERYVMIERAMFDNGASLGSFRIVPFPISFPDRLKYYVPLDAEFLLTIYDEWGESKLKRLQNMNFRTNVLWRRDQKGMTATDIRKAVALGEKWEHLVPPSTVRTVREYHIDERIRNMMANKQ